MNYTDHDDPAPVVFLLMEDMRFPGPEPDFQLAEVTVSLRPQVGEEGGWWADGEEVIKALQLTTSRLEGARSIHVVLDTLKFINIRRRKGICPPWQVSTMFCAIFRGWHYGVSAVDFNGFEGEIYRVDH